MGTGGKGAYLMTGSDCMEGKMLRLAGFRRVYNAVSARLAAAKKGIQATHDPPLCGVL
jgi:hypothetical protein